MAISGAEFTCKNKICKHNETGFNITSAWPLGDIDKVIESSKDNQEYVNGMLRLKQEGRKYAKIKMPNKENIPVLGYRIEKWCDSCKAIRLFDVINDTDEIGDTCFECNNKLVTFAEVTNLEGNGINCPSCNTKMKMLMWFANEKED